MMLKLSNISYERESGKFNFKVFLTVDVSISEVHGLAGIPAAKMLVNQIHGGIKEAELQ